ncbi:RebB family R body protein [Azospirillum doebereinerae]|uniref:Glycerol-3-phosphate dehydrogenase n=1 Tax=Azospirillum doebereinerae TaxID=92933 RepID=A0A433IZG1_9PROT|nr:RebB family R body protein [Azospirillum doebereinerae]RUQ60896.1 glycerol-3-phosphate dehydrogenase [Azospirillum doebereinerae]
MAYPTQVNSQITDAVTQTNVKVIGEAPAMALGEAFAKQITAMQGGAQNTANAQQSSLHPAIATGALYHLDAVSGEVKVVDGTALSATMRKLLGMDKEG